MDISSPIGKNIPAATGGKYKRADLDMFALDLNGDIEVGLGANADPVYDAKTHLEIGPSVADTCIRAVRICDAKGITEEDLILTAVTAAALVHSLDMVTDKCNAKATATPLKEDDITESEGKWMAKISALSKSNAATAIVATKVNFFVTNHHTGTPKIQGYAAKVAATTFKGCDRDQTANMMWTIGHWADTMQVWAAIGVKGITTATKFKVKANSDVTMRINGTPAGGAKLNLVATALELFGVSPLADWLKLPIAPKAIIDLYKAVLEDPIAYHVGGKALGHPGAGKTITVDESTWKCLSAYVHAAMPDHTLIKSKAIAKESEIQTHEWYLAIPGILKEVQAALKVDKSAMAEKFKDFGKSGVFGEEARAVALEIAAINTGRIA